MVEIVGLYVIRTKFDQTGTIQCLNKTKRDMEETNEVNTEKRKREELVNILLIRRQTRGPMGGSFFPKISRGSHDV